ncbi:MAG: cold shock domain-containing protein [Elioraea sp.]|nr:cold shock domain-containing protein [Elioraea sp.]
MDDDHHDGGSIEAPVKFFNRAKGFGFVTMADGSDIFFHVSALTPLGLSSVEQGDVLVCEVGDVPRGRQVTRVIEVKPGEGGARPPKREFGDRPPRREFGGGGFGDRPPRREFGGGAFGDRPPRRESGGGGFGDRPPRREFGGGALGDRPPRREFGQRAAAPTGPSEIVSGTVKFFDVRKGFGFIVPESGADVFVPLRALGAVTPESLTPGRRVKATVITGPKGRQALSVEVL